jgi:hypothetical protein
VATNTMRQQKFRLIFDLLEVEPGLKHRQIDKRLGWPSNTTYNLLPYMDKAGGVFLYEENDGLYIAFEQPSVDNV